MQGETSPNREMSFCVFSLDITSMLGLRKPSLSPSQKPVSLAKTPEPRSSAFHAFPAEVDNLKKLINRFCRH